MGFVDDAPLRAIYWNPPPPSDLTCPVCTTPIALGYSLCMQCHSHRGAAEQLADYVAPLSWAVMGGQAYSDVVSYKQNGPSAFAAQDRLQRLLTGAFQRHHLCLAPEWKDRALAFAAVPSTRGRSPHPLGELVNRFTPDGMPQIRMAYRGDTAADPNARRVLQPTDWEVENPAALHGIRRVVVVDDSWVTGGHAQSVASALRVRGRLSVGIVTFARVLKTGWGPTSDYLKLNQPVPFDPAVCPVHRVRHP